MVRAYTVPASVEERGVVVASEQTGSDDDRVFILAALKEVHDTVRSYDTKAQIVGVGFIFTLGVLKGFGESIGDPAATGTMTTALSWFLAVGPIVLFGSVLYPSRSRLTDATNSEGGIRYAFYFSTKQDRNIDDYLSDIATCDWRRELAFELMKASKLREMKRKRFIFALLMSAVSFLAIASFQISRTM